MKIPDVYPQGIVGSFQKDCYWGNVTW